MRTLTAVSTFIALVGGLSSPAFAQPQNSPARDAGGVRVHRVTSEYQVGETAIHVLLPDDLQPDTKLRVLYVLPVEPGEGHRWGDALAEVQRLQLHNEHRLICVYATFSDLPWYADHPTDEGLRQEAYFLRVVVPFIERTYPARVERSGRLLVGFSKSGWGAFSLLLRNPDLFERAAAWDAPLMRSRPDQFGMGPIFGTQENFERYQLSSLLGKSAADLRGQPRLIHLGYGNFRQHHLDMEALLDELQIAHEFADGPHRKHAWNSGWLADAVKRLVALP